MIGPVGWRRRAADRLLWVPQKHPVALLWEPENLRWARRREHDLRRARMREAGLGGVIAPGLSGQQERV